MAIPTNTPIEWRGTTVTLEANGSSITSGSVVQADDDTYDTSVDGEGAPDAEFVLSFAFASTPTENGVLPLMARPLDIRSTNDAEVPELARPTHWVGNFVVNNVTTTQYARLLAKRLPKNCSFYLGNSGTGQTVSAGWVLDVTPLALTPKT